MIEPNFTSCMILDVKASYSKKPNTGPYIALIFNLLEGDFAGHRAACTLKGFPDDPEFLASMRNLTGLDDIVITCLDFEKIPHLLLEKLKGQDMVGSVYAAKAGYLAIRFDYIEADITRG